jgi:hypothetical protein
MTTGILLFKDGREKERKSGGGVVRSTTYTLTKGREVGTEHHIVRSFPCFARSSFW